MVKVNGVRTRGGRSNFGRERYYYQNDERKGDWDCGRDRERDYDQARDAMLDNVWNPEEDRIENEQEHSRGHDRDVDREHSIDLNIVRKMDRTSDPDRSFDEDKKDQSRRNNE